MTIERFEIPGLSQYAYIVSSEGKAVLIDPIRDTDRYTRYLAERRLVLTHILETHIHADFASGATALSEETGSELALSGYDQGQRYLYRMPHRALRTGDTIQVGSLRLQALHTPGHTPEHLSFLLFDTQRDSAEPIALFSGDFLFVCALGRPDLLGEESKHALANELFSSLQRLEGLPDALRVYPKHGAGSFCGAGMADTPESTLGHERRTNPLFAIEREAFVSEVLRTVPPLPGYYPRMKELNSHGAASVALLPALAPFSPPQLASARQDPAVLVLDVRTPEAFEAAHIPASINIGAGPNLSLWAGWLLPPESRIVLVAGHDAIEPSRGALLRVGLDNVIAFLEGGFEAWIEAGLDIERTPPLTAAQVQQQTPPALVLDVRSDAEWSSGHIHGARHLMIGDLPTALGTLPRGQTIVTVCESGYRASMAASLLLHAGFAAVHTLKGGMQAWKQASLPTETP